MAWVALALFALLVLSATVQVLVRSRSAGASRFRLFGNRLFSAEWWSGCAPVAGLGCAGLGPVANLVGRVAPIAALDRAGIQIAALAVWCAAAVPVRGSQVVLGPSWRIGVVPGTREALVLRGPFRVARHPMYTGLVALLLATASVDPTSVALGAVPFALVG